MSCLLEMVLLDVDNMHIFRDVPDLLLPSSLAVDVHSEEFDSIRPVAVCFGSFSRIPAGAIPGSNVPVVGIAHQLPSGSGPKAFVFALLSIAGVVDWPKA